MLRTIPISKARESFTSIVDDVNKKLDEVVITVNGTPAVIMVSIDEYESLQETLDILSDKKLMKDIRQGEREIKEGKDRDWDEVKKELGWDV